jgi:hypothetical protein
MKLIGEKMKKIFISLAVLFSLVCGETVAEEKARALGQINFEFLTLNKNHCYYYNYAKSMSGTSKDIYDNAYSK